jgi:hypothetical protein
MSGSSESPRPEVHPLSRDELVLAEGRRPDEDLFGLALSGGGIRSATFNLGLLQALQRTRLLNQLDYVSTVSGGGYIGGFWTAWRHNGNTPGSFPARPTAGVEAPAVRHLRRFSNYLSPRLGLLSSDTGRLAVAGLTAAIPTLLATLSFLVLAILGWTLAAATLFDAGPWAYRVFFAVTLVVLAVAEALWRDREGRPINRTYNLVGAVVLVFVALAIAMFTMIQPLAVTGDPASSLRLPTPETTAGAGWVRYFLPALTWGAVFFILTMLRALASRFTSTFERVDARAALDRVLGRLLLLIAAWSVVTALWLGAAWLHARFVTGGAPMPCSARTATPATAGA